MQATKSLVESPQAQRAATPAVIDRSTITEEVMLARWELARRHPKYFQRWFVWTCDQHDIVQPIKQWCWWLPYVQIITELWLDNPRLVLIKSRQMRMTWLFVILYLWDFLFHDGRLIMFQSKREEDAIGDETAGDGLLGRAKFIMNHLPGRSFLVPDYIPLGHKMLRPSGNSTIWAIPQGAAIIRQRTASGILSDESSFQPEAGDSYTAARPTIRGGGRYSAITTPDLADGGHTRRLHEDRLDEV